MVAEKITDLKIKEIEEMFPKIGKLTKKDLDEEISGSLIRALIQSELKDEGYRFSGGRKKTVDQDISESNFLGVAWGPRVTSFQIMDGYVRWKSIILSSRERIKND